MQLNQFKQLIKNREKFNIDYKIICEAFRSKQKAPNAELAKDICAMANNGNISSYIIIGISDDGKSYKTVDNQNLTDDKLQDFCKHVIYPPPAVSLKRIRWNPDPRELKPHEFVVIQIGPNPTQAFSLAEDYIAYKENLCLRRNEVWIRRGATSDLATPREIARLVKGKSFNERQKIKNNQLYARLAINEIEDVITSDIANCLLEIGGNYYDKRIVLPLRKQNFVFKCVLLKNLTGRNRMNEWVAKNWSYEHGLILFVTGNVSQASMHNAAELSFKEKWGWLSILPSRVMRKGKNSIKVYPSYDPVIPDNTTEFGLTLVALPNIIDTDTLTNMLLDFKKFIDSDDQSFNRMLKIRQELEINLERWVNKGWELEKEDYSSNIRRTTFVKYSNKVLKKDAQSVLDYAKASKR